MTFILLAELHTIICYHSSRSNGHLAIYRMIMKRNFNRSACLKEVAINDYIMLMIVYYYLLSNSRIHVNLMKKEREGKHVSFLDHQLIELHTKSIISVLSVEI